MLCFPCFHLPEAIEMWTADRYSSYVALEPICQVYRTRLHRRMVRKGGRIRWGLLMDTGAPQSAVGCEVLDKFINMCDLSEYVEREPFQNSISGVGSGAATVNHKIKIPVGLEQISDDFKTMTFQAQVLEGCGAAVPALYGLEGMLKAKGVFDFRSTSEEEQHSPGIYRYHTMHGTFRIYLIHGHIILPADWGGDDNIPDLNQFLGEKLGLEIFYGDHSNIDDHTTLAENMCVESSESQPVLVPSCEVQVTIDSNESESAGLSKGQSNHDTQENLNFLLEGPPGLSKFDNPTTSTFDQMSAFVHRTHNFLSRVARKELERNPTYRKRYRPLPSDTIPPEPRVEEGQWDLWELWSGSGTLTKIARSRGLKVGPPITRENGWELSSESHQKALWKLFRRHKPKIIFGSPTCAPWSSANRNMDENIKALIRKAEEESFLFYYQLCEEQYRENRAFVLEQPRASELLKINKAERLVTVFHAKDTRTDMCAHGLKDPENGKPCMKPTILRGTVKLVKVAVLCECKEEHQKLEGYCSITKTSRTLNAQTYMPLFCVRLVSDFKRHLQQGRTFVFPVEDEENMRNPSLRRPRDTRVVEESDEEAERMLKDLSEQQKRAMNEELEKDKEIEADILESLAKEKRKERGPIDDGVIKPPYIQPTSKRLPAPPKGQGGSSSSRAKPQEIEEETEGRELAEVPRQDKPMLEEEEKLLEQVCSLGIQLIAGGQRTFQTGKHFEAVQRHFCEPSNHLLKLAVLSRKPQYVPTPEPLVARDQLTHYQILTQAKDDEVWKLGPRKLIADYNKEPRMYRERPLWTITLFTKEAEHMDLSEALAQSPLDTLAEAREQEQLKIDSLPDVLRQLIGGTTEQKLKLLLLIHKRLGHRGEAELRQLLYRSGIPVRVLPLVGEACKLCPDCRRWATPKSAPAIKSRVSAHFNTMVYGDLVFLTESNHVFLVLVDDCTRYCTVTYVSSRDTVTLQSGIRRGWTSKFGPPLVLRTDSESAIASDAMGIYLESIGVKRELVLAKEGHTTLGPIDRKIKLIRLAAPRIIESLSQDSVIISTEDLACELEYLLNTQLTYGGVSPYMCLFGAHPRELFNDEVIELSSYDQSLPFLEHIHIRLKSIACFQQALLRFRVEKGLKSRSRPDHTQAYTPGQLIDIFLKSTKKDYEGWRGPGVVIGYGPEGRITVRWQSVLRDMPAHLVRPHISVLTPIAASTNPLIKEPGEQQAQFINEAEESDNMKLYLMHREGYEKVFDTDSADQLRGPFFDSLISLTSCLQLATQHFHVVMKSGFSNEVKRDGGCIFNLGKKQAEYMNIPNYAGIIVTSGRRYVASQKEVRRMHHIVWTRPEFCKVIVKGANENTDFVLEGCCEYNELHLLRAFSILEGKVEVDTGTFLKDLIREEVRNEELIDKANHRMSEQVGRPRGEWPNEQFDEMSDPGPSVSEAGINIEGEDDREYFFSSCGAKELLRQADCESTRCPSEESFISPSVYPSNPNTGSNIYFVFGEDDDKNVVIIPGSFPINRLARPLTPAEEIEFKTQVDEAKMKELKSWCETKTMRPRKKSSSNKSRGRPITARWVITWKNKGGEWGVKARLCIRGFLQPQDPQEQSHSPTAQRLSHRVVLQQVVQQRWKISSLDISTAFLKGLSFEEIRKEGIVQPEVSFTPPADVWEFLKKLAPDDYSFCEGIDWELELLRSAYGLRSAPLLWFLRCDKVLKTLGWEPTRHDSCCYVKRNSKTTETEGLLTVHVDDLLIGTGDEIQQVLQKGLEREFGTLTCERDDFTHFGMQISHDIPRNSITASQADYLTALEPINVAEAKLKIEDLVGGEMTTQYRALVSGMAWVGLTHPGAMASASMLQGCLPNPKKRDCIKLNRALEQLKEQYEPLSFIRISAPFRLLEISDSSFANVGEKYAQGGYLTFLTKDSDEGLSGDAVLLDYKSNKSKRVATSTMHAEILAQCVGVESTMFLQSFLDEINKPKVGAFEHIRREGTEFPIVSCVDCKDAYEATTSAALLSGANKGLTIYVSALRECRAERKVKAFCWIDTRCMPSNMLTKIDDNGELEYIEYREVYGKNKISITHPYLWERQWVTD